jgi:peptidoglycan/xylan/chitin deacetylase (PgdA/CDA1 family)
MSPRLDSVLYDIAREPARFASASGCLDVCITVDMEPDCPPYLWTWRGIDEGFPQLSALLDVEKVPVTYFATGSTAQYAPAAIREIVAGGHELGCHGMTHRRFSEMNRETAASEIRESVKLLRDFSWVTSFRAPYLDFPDRFLDLVVDAGFTVDASLAKYKHLTSVNRSIPLRRIPASITSSALRLPRWVCDPWLSLLRSPIVLFVHPWEFVDFTKERLRWDCRFRTGEPALRALQSTIHHFKRRGARFLTINQLWLNSSSEA